MGTEPTLADVIKDGIESRLLDVFQPTPAKVLVFYPAAPGQAAAVDAQPVVRRSLPIDDEGTLESEALPAVCNVPVLYPAGGSVRVSWDLAPGDHVLLIPLYLAITQWRLTGQEITAPVSDQGLHHLANCVALPCLTADVNASAPGASGGFTVDCDDVRLGAPDASDYVALASLVRAELDAIKNTLGSLTAGAQSFAIAYNPNDVAATRVKAK